MTPDAQHHRPGPSRAVAAPTIPHPKETTVTTTHAPRRIRRQRTVGWTLAGATTNPAGAVIVSRPSRFGNHCKVSLMEEMGYVDPHAAAAEIFRSWLNGDRFHSPTDAADRRRERILRELPTLRGLDLACTCKPEHVCHGDYLLDRANLHPDSQAAWVASVRARVNRGRAVDGLPPLAAGATPGPDNGGAA